MFNIGDELRYTGKYKNCLTGSAAKGDVMRMVSVAHNPSGRGGLSGQHYVYVQTRTGPMACYVADLELAGPAEPEPYEAWFV